MTTDPATEEFSTGEQTEAKRYHQAQLRCDLADRAIDLGYLCFAAGGLAIPLDKWLHDSVHWTRPVPRLAAIYLIVTLLHFAVSFSLSIYSGYFLEHRFGLSRQSLGRWFTQYGKRVGLTLSFGLLIAIGLYTIIWTARSWWWLVAAIAFFVVSVVVGQLFPVVVLPLFQKSERLDNATLLQRFQQLATGTGLTIEGVYRLQVSLDTAKANAQLAGIGGTRRVLLDDTLLDTFTNDELAVIFAHEVGHHVHRHIPKMVVMGVLTSGMMFFVSDRILSRWVTHIDGDVDYANFPVYALPMFSLVFLVCSFALEPVQNFVSRFFERQADRYALRTTQSPEAFRSAFLKLAKLNKIELQPPPWEVALFHSHPPITERLRLIES